MHAPHTFKSFGCVSLIASPLVDALRTTFHWVNLPPSRDGETIAGRFFFPVGTVCAVGSPGRRDCRCIYVCMLNPFLLRGDLFECARLLLLASPVAIDRTVGLPHSSTLIDDHSAADSDDTHTRTTQTDWHCDRSHTDTSDRAQPVRVSLASSIRFDSAPQQAKSISVQPSAHCASHIHLSPPPWAAA